MRSIFIIGLFLIPALSFGQNKKDTKIIVKVSDTANLFNRLVSSFYDRGYTLEEKDPVGGLMLTKEQNIKNDMTWSVIYRARVTDSTILITGKVWSMLADGIMNNNRSKTFTDITYMGSKKSPMMLGWYEMVEIVKQFGTLAFTK